MLVPLVILNESIEPDNLVTARTTWSQSEKYDLRVNVRVFVENDCVKFYHKTILLDGNPLFFFIDLPAEAFNVGLIVAKVNRTITS